MSERPRVGSLEREHKLNAPVAFTMPDLDDVMNEVAAVSLPDQVLAATYYDTPDLRLARAGITLRFRTGEERSKTARSGKWTLKLPEGDRGPSMVRREIDVVACAEAIPQQLDALVRAHVRSAGLTPVGLLRTRRHRVELRNRAGINLAEVADDEVSVVNDREVTLRFREIEVEVTGDAGPALLSAVVDRLLDHGAMPAEQTPKILRALGPRALEPPEAHPVELRRGDATLRDVVVAAVTAGLARLLRHDPGVRLGGDVEDVHQARVAARRLRSDLRTFRELLDDEGAGRLRAELQWLGNELGQVRDLDVLHERFRRQTASLAAIDARAATGLLRRLDTERDVAREALLASLESDRYVGLLDSLAAASSRPPLAVSKDADAHRLAVDDLPRFVRGPWKHLRRAAEAIGHDPKDEALHEVRIRAKRARYAAEAAAPVVGKPAARFAKGVAAVQSVLGDLQDAVVAEQWLRAAGSRGPAAQALVAGQLVSVQRHAMETARRDWAAAWEQASVKSRRSWLG